MSTQKRPSTIDDALKILDEALVKQQLPDLSPLLGDEFNAVKTKITETFTETSRSELKDLKKGLQVAQEFAQEFGKEIGAELQKKVQENPWPIIGGVAIGAAALGFLLGHRGAKQQGANV